MAFAFTTGLEFFRSTKEAVLRAQAILSVFTLAVAVAYGGSARLRELLRHRVVLAIAGAAVLWTAITTLTSAQRSLSAESLISVIFGALLFFCIWYISRDVPISALLILVPATVINTIVVILQEYGFWNPFSFGLIKSGHLSASGFIGNPNEVGAYLALCTVVLLVASEFLHGWKRWACAIASAISLAGVFISLTRTAVLAIAAALIVMAVRRSYKGALAIAGILLVALVIATQFRVAALSRITAIPSQISEGRWDYVLSDRLPAFLAAVEMFRDHPILGTGPRTFGFLFFPYRLELDRLYPNQLLIGAGTNFAEVHNDHLQLLAETGLPGYALFLAALVVLVVRSRPRDDPQSEYARFAWELSPPFVAAVFVLALAFFPLHVAITRHLIITIAALITGWSRR